MFHRRPVSEISSIAIPTGIRFLVVVLSLANLGAGSADLRVVEAAKKADVATVRALLKQGTDVKARAGDGATALHWAAYRDAQEMAELLIRAGAPVNAVNDLGVTPVWVASSNRNTSVMTTLLKAGADPNLAPRTGGTPLMVAARMGNVEAVKLLLSHGANVDVKEGAEGQTALMWAVVKQQTEVVRTLIESGADLHARTATVRRHVLLCCQAYNGDPRGEIDIDYGGFTPLLFAAREGAVDPARLLLAAGANIDDTAADGTSALTLAVSSGQGPLAAFLIEKGAELNAAGAGYTALHAAVMRKDLTLVKALIAHGANLNARLTKGTPARRGNRDFAFEKTLVGATPFLLAAKLAELDLMRALAAGGADMTLGLPDGTTPLIIATTGEQVRTNDTVTVVPGQKVDREPERLSLEAIKVAVELGADVNAANSGGDTALHVAALKRFNSVIQFLAERGAHLEAKNTRRATPLAVALTPPPPLPGTFVATQGDFRTDEGPQTAELLRTLGAKN